MMSTDKTDAELTAEFIDGIAKAVNGPPMKKTRQCSVDGGKTWAEMEPGDVFGLFPGVEYRVVAVDQVQTDTLESCPHELPKAKQPDKRNLP